MQSRPRARAAFRAAVQRKWRTTGRDRRARTAAGRERRGRREKKWIELFARARARVRCAPLWSLVTERCARTNMNYYHFSLGSDVAGRLAGGRRDECGGGGGQNEISSSPKPTLRRTSHRIPQHPKKILYIPCKSRSITAPTYYMGNEECDAGTPLMEYFLRTSAAHVSFNTRNV